MYKNLVEYQLDKEKKNIVKDLRFVKIIAIETETSKQERERERKIAKTLIAIWSYFAGCNFDIFPKSQFTAKCAVIIFNCNKTIAIIYISHVFSAIYIKLPLVIKKIWGGKNIVSVPRDGIVLIR